MTLVITASPGALDQARGTETMFYAAFPPEFNSGRMYSGAGSGSIAGRRGGLGRTGQPKFSPPWAPIRR